MTTAATATVVTTSTVGTTEPAPPSATPGRKTLTVPLPRVGDLPGCTVVIGVGTLHAALADNALPTHSPFIWPMVVLAVASLGYDLGLRALRARRRS